MEDKVKSNQMEINELRAEVEKRKSKLETYRTVIKEKEIMRQRKVALAKRKAYRCGTHDVSFPTPAAFASHQQKFHLENPDEAQRQLEEEKQFLEVAEEEEREAVKDMISGTKEAISQVIS